ncbi:MAG: response regulator [Proteobacteria bacterium]|nr:response regulator [Pseudomonadota bacterium]
MAQNRLLVIDDDIGIRIVLKEIFTFKEYEVVTAASGKEAIETAEAREFDVAMIDIHLPDMLGIDLLRQLKAKQPDLECVIITGDLAIENATAAIKEGACGYFIKPLIIDDVAHRLEEIIERKKMRQEIRQLNELPRIILNSINASIAIIDAEDFRLISVNEAFLEEAGLPEKKVVGRHCYKVTHGSDEPCKEPDDICPLHETVANGSHSMVEHVHFNGAGEKKFVEVSTSPIFDSNGKVIQVVHVTRDVTERKALEESLVNEKLLHEEAHIELLNAYDELKKSQTRVIQQEKMASIGQLAAGVAHEINNPMGFIASNLTSLGKYVGKCKEYMDAQEAALKGGIDESVIKELKQLRKKLKIDFVVDDIGDLIAESLDGAERVKKIVQNLKSFSRMDEDEMHAADINECIETTLNIVWNELKYNCTVEKDYGDLPRINCYPQQLNQVFMNLLTNAAHAIKDKGVISIKTVHDEKNILITISDTGCGIPEENLQKLFEPFFTTKPAGKGTGLGMSIADDIIKKHHGEILVKSEVGKGTTFTVKLPVEEK